MFFLLLLHLVFESASLHTDVQDSSEVTSFLALETDKSETLVFLSVSG